MWETLGLWSEFVSTAVLVLWPALIAVGVIVGLQVWLARRGSRVAAWHWLWGVVLGIVVSAAAWEAEVMAETMKLIERKNAGLVDAYGIIIIVLLCIIIFRRPTEIIHREIRVVRPGAESEDL
jgi:hypothetical protein